MTTPALRPVILSGGSGLRLWPLSRPDAPKQLIPLVDERSMLQTTLMRLDGLEGVLPPLVVCNATHRSGVHRDLIASGHGDGSVIVEPMGRNTAPAVAAAAATCDEDTVLLVMPADHLIGDVTAFHGAVRTGIGAATAGRLVTFGIVPDHAATGYGYIASTGGGAVRPVDRFVEKPDLPTAERFIADGYLWNSGMFMFTAAAYIQELELHAPEIVEASSKATEGATRCGRDLVLDAEAFATAPSISIDYAVMEHTAHAVVVPLDADWTDLGSFEALHGLGVPDADGNVTVGRVVVSGTIDSYVRSEGPLVATIGVEGLVVVATQDAILVADRLAGQEIKALVARLEEQGYPEGRAAAVHRTAWGRSTVLAEGDGVRAIRLDVQPGAGVDLEAGTATVLRGFGTVGGRSLGPGDTVAVEADATTRLENPGPGPLVAVATTPG